MLKMVKYQDPESGEPDTIVTLADVQGCIEGWMDIAHHGQKVTLELVEMTQEEYDALPDY